MGEKRKNGSPRRVQWGLLVIGFALGVLLTLAVTSGRTQTNAVLQPPLPPDTLWLTATSIVQDATASALSAPPQDPALDSILASATAMVVQATQTAQAGR